MTDSDAEPEELPEVSEADARPVDAYLDLLMSIVLRDDNPDSHFGLTITLGSGVISGTAISRVTWESAWLEQLRSGGLQADIVETLRDGLELRRADDNDVRRRLREADRPAGALRYLHMRDVACWSAVAGDAVRLPLWRGRLEQVDGWSLGKLGRD